MTLSRDLIRAQLNGSKSLSQEQERVFELEQQVCSEHVEDPAAATSRPRCGAPTGAGC